MADLSAAVDNFKEGVTDASERVAAVLPLWVIIIIVVVGTGVLALLVGLCCLCACRRRRGMKAAGDHGTGTRGFSDIHHHSAIAPSSDGGSRSSEEGPGGRHKLRKRRPSSSSSSSFGNDADGVVPDDRGVQVEEVEQGRGRGEPEFCNMASVPAQKASLLAIPPLLTGALRASIVSIGRGRRSGGGGSGRLNIRNNNAADQGNNWHRRRTSNAWIDDDALHGPDVSPTKRSSARRKSRIKSWRASIRESWPLKTPSPTLPHLPQFGGHDGRQVGAAEHESVALFQYKNYDGADSDQRLAPNLPPRLSAAARQRNGQLSPPRQLPKPPSQALLAANASRAGLRPIGNFYGAGLAVSDSPRNRGLSYYKYEDTDQPVKSTGSPHSKTGRGVGVGTGVVGPRGRGPPAGSTMTQILRETEKRLQGGMVTGVERRNRSSSSPPRRTPGLGLGPNAVTVAMVRSRSRTPSPTKASRAPHGGAPSHVRQGSQASFVSEPDSLFDDSPPTLLYHGLTSPSRSKPSPQLSPHKRRPSLVPSFASSASSLSTIHSETEEGASTPNTTAPNSSIPFGMNQIAGLGDPFMPSKSSTPASRGGQGSGIRPIRRDKDSYARSASPPSPVAGNMRSPDTTPTRGGSRNMTARGTTPQSQRNRSSVTRLPASARGDSPSDGAHKRTPSDDPAAATTPSLYLTIPSDRGKSTPLVKRLSALAPPFRSRDQTPEVAHAHPSPALSNARLSSVYDLYADISEPSNINNSNMNHEKNRRRAGGEVRMVSSSASISSSLYSDTGAAERERERQNAALSRISMLLNRDVMAPSRPKPTVRVVPQDYYRHGAGGGGGSNESDARVSATVAELRRMNSQVSSYSTAAASTYSDGSSSAAAAAVRPESVVPPRNKGAAARNYHALASSPVKSSPDREGVRGRAEVGALTPTRDRRLQRAGSEEMGGGGSGSEDGVSLYDQDGFYITPARGTGSRS